MEDKYIVTNGGHWFWGNSGLILDHWMPWFDLITQRIKILLVRVNLPYLLLVFWKHRIFEKIGHKIGLFLQLDDYTNMMEKTPMAKICVEKEPTMVFDSKDGV
jgi:hypothetical protein